MSREELIEKYEEAGFDLDINKYNDNLWTYTLWYWEDLLILSTKDGFSSEEEVIDYLEKNYDEIIRDARKQIEEIYA